MSKLGKDPRHNNDVVAGNSVSEYFAGYRSMLHDAIAKVPASKLEDAFALLKKALRAKARIYVAGNGGSAAIADHLCCDWMKGTHVPGEYALKVHSLTANSSLFTAIANDFGYDQTIAKQLEMLGEPGDIVVLISSSGNSANILEAAEFALSRKMLVIGLSAFSGGKLNELATVSLHVPVKNYGMAEDAHQMIMHVLAQYLAKVRDGGKGTL